MGCGDASHCALADSLRAPSLLIVAAAPVVFTPSAITCSYTALIVLPTTGVPALRTLAFRGLVLTSVTTPRSPGTSTTTARPCTD